MYTNCCTVNCSHCFWPRSSRGPLACNWKRQINKLPDVPQAVKKQSLSACQASGVFFQLVSPPQVHSHSDPLPVRRVWWAFQDLCSSRGCRRSEEAPLHSKNPI